MHLERLALTNFKCFPQQTLSFSKLTLLLGANSTGKSSLLHGVLAALQSGQFPFALSANGNLVNLGDFRAISHRHRRDSHVQVVLEFGGHQLGAVKFAGTFSHSAKTGMPELHTAEVSDPGFSLRVSRDDRYRAEWTYNSEGDPLRRNLQKSTELRQIFEGIGRLMREVQKGPRKLQEPQTGEAALEDPLAVPPPSGKFAFSRLGEFFECMAQSRHMLLAHHFGVLSTTIPEIR